MPSDWDIADEEYDSESDDKRFPDLQLEGEELSVVVWEADSVVRGATGAQATGIWLGMGLFMEVVVYEFDVLGLDIEGDIKLYVLGDAKTFCCLNCCSSWNTGDTVMTMGALEVGDCSLGAREIVWTGLGDESGSIFEGFRTSEDWLMCKDGYSFLGTGEQLKETWLGKEL